MGTAEVRFQFDSAYRLDNGWALIEYILIDYSKENSWGFGRIDKKSS